MIVDKDKIIELLDAIDAIARDYDSYDFGLPLGSESTRNNLIAAVEEWLEEITGKIR